LVTPYVEKRIRGQGDSDSLKFNNQSQISLPISEPSAALDREKENNNSACSLPAALPSLEMSHESVSPQHLLL
jgi:hypothetical protein